MHGKRRLLAFALGLCVLLSACGAAQELTADAARPTQPEASAAPAAGSAPATEEKAPGSYVAPALQLSPFDESAAAGENGVELDISHTAQGYVAVRAVCDSKLKFQVVFGESKYNYDLPGDGTAHSFPLQSGDGSYTFRVMQNTSGSKYAELYAQTAEVTMEDEFQPYLRPSQLVNYDAGSDCVQLAAQLAQSADTDAEVVAGVYDYIVRHISYDTDKAASVESGYLPDPDATLTEGRGICFDYAALAAAMLRSQGIPTRLITGYVSPGGLYHAWNMIWLEDEGWITVNLQAPADQWQRIDLTFAAAAASEYTGDGNSYTDRYVY